jgi:hypothetical protein
VSALHGTPTVLLPSPMSPTTPQDAYTNRRLHTSLRRPPGRHANPYDSQITPVDPPSDHVRPSTQDVLDDDTEEEDEEYGRDEDEDSVEAVDVEEDVEIDNADGEAAIEEGE